MSIRLPLERRRRSAMERWKDQCAEWQQVKDELIDRARRRHEQGPSAFDVTKELSRRMRARGEVPVEYDEILAEEMERQDEKIAEAVDVVRHHPAVPLVRGLLDVAGAAARAVRRLRGRQ